MLNEDLYGAGSKKEPTQAEDYLSFGSRTDLLPRLQEVELSLLSLISNERCFKFLRRYPGDCMKNRDCF